MRGHEPLIAQRLRGKRPDLVAVEVGGPPTWQSANWHRFTPRHAQLHIADADPLQRLDLRCLVGLNVTVFGQDPQRVGAAVAAIQAAGARRVLACAYTVTEQAGDVRTTIGPVFDSMEPQPCQAS